MNVEVRYIAVFPLPGQDDNKFFPCYAHELFNHARHVRDMFQNVGANGRIKRSILEWKRLQISFYKGIPTLRRGILRRYDIDPRDLVAFVGQLLREISTSTASV